MSRPSIAKGAETSRFMTIDDAANQAAQRLEHEPLHDWIVLGYKGSRETLYLLGEGRQGLGVIEMRTVLTTNDINFGLLKIEGRVLLWTHMPDRAVSGVRRARALVHSRALASTFRHDATFTAARSTEFTSQIVRYKLKLDGTSSLPSSPLLEQTQQQSHHVSPQPLYGATFTSDEDEEQVLDVRPANSTHPQSTVDIHHAMNGLHIQSTPSMQSIDRSPSPAHSITRSNHSHSQSHSNSNSISISHAHVHAQSHAQSHSQLSPSQSYQYTQDPYHSPPVHHHSKLRHAFEPSQPYPTPPTSIERFVQQEQMHTQLSSRFSADSTIMETRSNLSRRDTNGYDGLESVYGGQADESPTTSPSQRSVRKDPSTLTPMDRADERAAVALAEEMRRRKERERTEREYTIRSERERKEREAKERAKEVVEREQKARWEYEQRQREREQAAELSRQEMEEKNRRELFEKMRKEEQARIEEKRRIEEERQRRIEEDALKAQWEQRKLLMDQQALIRKMAEDEEAQAREVSRRREQAELKAKFAEVKAQSGRVLLDGHVSVQGGNSMFWRRRFFELQKDQLVLYKSATEKTPVGAIPLGEIIQLTESPEEAGVANSFKLTMRDEDEWTFYTDEPKSKEVLASGLQFAAGL